MTELTEYIKIDILELYKNYTEECAYIHYHREGSSYIGVLIYEWKFAIEVMRRRCYRKKGFHSQGYRGRNKLAAFVQRKLYSLGML